MWDGNKVIAHGGYLYFLESYGTVWAFDGSRTTKVFTSDRGYIDAHFTVSDKGNLYFRNPAGIVQVRGLSAVQVLTADLPYAAMAVQQDTVYLGDTDGDIWSMPFSDEAISAPAPTKGKGGKR